MMPETEGKTAVVCETKQVEFCHKLCVDSGAILLLNPEARQPHLHISHIMRGNGVIVIIQLVIMQFLSQQRIQSRVQDNILEDA